MPDTVVSEKSVTDEDSVLTRLDGSKLKRKSGVSDINRESASSGPSRKSGDSNIHKTIENPAGGDDTQSLSLASSNTVKRSGSEKTFGQRTSGQRGELKRSIGQVTPGLSISDVPVDKKVNGQTDTGSKKKVAGSDYEPKNEKILSPWEDKHQIKPGKLA